MAFYGVAIFTYPCQSPSSAQKSPTMYRHRRSAKSWKATGRSPCHLSPNGNAVQMEKNGHGRNGNCKSLVWSQAGVTNIQMLQAEYRNGSWTSPQLWPTISSVDGQDVTG